MRPWIKLSYACVIRTDMRDSNTAEQCCYVSTTLASTDPLLHMLRCPSQHCSSYGRRGAEAAPVLPGRYSVLALMLAGTYSWHVMCCVVAWMSCHVDVMSFPMDAWMLTPDAKSPLDHLAVFFTGIVKTCTCRGVGTIQVCMTAALHVRFSDPPAVIARSAQEKIASLCAEFKYPVKVKVRVRSSYWSPC